jgi:chromosome segregation ATPase
MMRSLQGLAFTVLLAASACARDGEAAEPSKPKTSTAEVKKQAAEAVEATGHYVSESKDEYAERMQRRIDALNAELARLGKKAKDSGKEARKGVDEKIAELEAKKGDAEKKLAELRKASGSAWESLKTGVEQAVDELDDAVRGPAKKPAGAKP